MKPTFLLLVLFLGSLQAETNAVERLFTQAVAGGNLDALDNLLSAGFNPNLPVHGETPLFLAMQRGRIEVVDFLLARHADPNAAVFSSSDAGPGNPTPLQFAIQQDNLRLASRLIASGARVNAIGRAGSTALLTAVSDSRLDAMRLLIDRGADVNTRDAEGASALDYAIWRGSLDAVAILVAHGARLNEPDGETGATPINEAVFRGKLSVVEYLLRFHPDLGIRDKRGLDPLDQAIRKGQEDAAQLLLEAEPNETRTPQFLAKVMEAAASKDEPVVVAALLKHGDLANGLLPAGLTPLDLSASAGANKVARVLLDNGADPNLAVTSGAFPLEEAALRGFDSIVRLLLDGGARVNQRNNNSGTTALYAAASFGKTEIVKLLLNRGADPAVCGANAKSPYQAAQENGYGEVATILREHDGARTCRQ
jgi:ankyrin repeat protein